MTTRLSLCLAVSLLIHALVLVQPWNLMAVSKMKEQPSPGVPVRLLDKKELPKDLFEKGEDSEKDQGEGLSFEAEGYVSAGYMDLLKSKIFKAWEYPEDAIRDGREGVVRVRFVLDREGRVVESSVLRSSGSASLDGAAESAISKAGPYGPFTDEVDAGTLGITGNFCYVLD